VDKVIIKDGKVVGVVVVSRSKSMELENLNGISTKLISSSLSAAAR